MEELEKEKVLEQYKYYSKLMNKFSDPCRKILYHYTSAESFKGIIENNELWLTNIEFVNDLTECKALQTKKTLFQNSKFKTKDVLERWNDYVGRDFSDEFSDGFVNTRNIKNMYIISFSTENDESLSQWRAYGSYRIGFDFKIFKKRMPKLYKCVYREKDIKGWILKKDRLEEWDKLDNSYMKEAAAYNLIDIASRKFKNKYFKDEKEFRMIKESAATWDYPDEPEIYLPQPPIHFRNRPGYSLPVPYVKFFYRDKEQQPKVQSIPCRSYEEMKEFKINEELTIARELLPIKEVMIGPIPNRKKEKIACEIFLKDHGFHNVKVGTSDIPYRGF